jgi:hypothetical protein
MGAPRNKKLHPPRRPRSRDGASAILEIQQMEDTTENRSMQVRHPLLKERMEWYWLVCADEKLESSAKVLASRIALYHFNSKTGQCNPSAKTLAAAIGRHPRAIDPALKALRESGWINWTKKVGSSSSYTLEKVPFDAAPMQPAADLSEEVPTTSTSEGVRRRHRRGGMQSTAEKPVTLEPVREPVFFPQTPTANAAGATTQTGASGGIQQKTTERRQRSSRNTSTQSVQTELPIDWQPDENQKALARQSGVLDRDLGNAVDQFKAHHRGRGTMSPNWGAMWWSWCLGRAERDQRKKPAPSRHQIFR